MQLNNINLTLHWATVFAIAINISFLWNFWSELIIYCCHFWPAWQESKIVVEKGDFNSNSLIRKESVFLIKKNIHDF